MFFSSLAADGDNMQKQAFALGKYETLAELESLTLEQLNGGLSEES